MPKQKITATGFAALNHNGRAPYVMTWSARAQASQVRAAVVDNWPRRNGSPQNWADIRKSGISVCKVKIEVVE